MSGRICKNCNKNIRGRSDKKFCSISCKNAYHYQQKNSIPQAILVIDKILHKNHGIMSALFQTKHEYYFYVAKTKMTELGFNFSYFTGTYKNSKGKVYHYIYDYAWMEFSNQEIMVVKGKYWTAKGVEEEMPDYQLELHD